MGENGARVFAGRDAGPARVVVVVPAAEVAPVEALAVLGLGLCGRLPGQQQQLCVREFRSSSLTCQQGIASKPFTSFWFLDVIIPMEWFMPEKKVF